MPTYGLPLVIKEKEESEKHFQMKKRSAINRKKLYLDNEKRKKKGIYEASRLKACRAAKSTWQSLYLYINNRIEDLPLPLTLA